MKRKYNNYIIMANEFLLKSEYIKAQEAYIKSLEFAMTNKELTDSYFEIADIYLIEGEYEKALQTFRKIIEIDENLPGSYYGIAVYYDLKNDLDLAKKYYELAISKDETYDRAYYYLAHILDRMGRKDEAMECLFKCIELDPYDYVSYNDLGSFYEERSEFETALKYIDESLKICPCYFRALYNRGVVLYKMDRPMDALKEYKKALDESTEEDIYLNMSAIYISLKDYKSAIEILLEGIEENPDSENLYYNLGCSYEKIGRRREAVDAIKKSIELNEDILKFAKNDIDMKKILEEEDLIG